jgi:hypothetical protein
VVRIRRLAPHPFSVMPAKAGTQGQRFGLDPLLSQGQALDPRFRGGDEGRKWEPSVWFNTRRSAGWSKLIYADLKSNCSSISSVGLQAIVCSTPAIFTRMQPPPPPLVPCAWSA